MQQRLNVNRWDPKAVSLIRNGIDAETSDALERTVTNAFNNAAENIVNKVAAVAVASQFQFIQPGVQHVQIPLAVPTCSPSSILGENFLKKYMNIVPQLSGGLLDQINAKKEPIKYNMDVQKAISEIQRKPMMYTSPGSMVISSDGKGIQNCQAKPDATTQSMNQRFA